MGEPAKDVSAYDMLRERKGLVAERDRLREALEKLITACTHPMLGIVEPDYESYHAALRALKEGGGDDN